MNEEITTKKQPLKIIFAYENEKNISIGNNEIMKLSLQANYNTNDLRRYLFSLKIITKMFGK